MSEGLTKTVIIAGVTGIIFSILAISLLLRPEPVDPGDSALKNSKVAYENGLQSMENKDYVRARDEFRKVIERDKNYNRAQKKQKQIIAAYRKNMFKDVSALGARSEYEDALKTLTAARSIIPEDDKIPVELERYSKLMRERDEKIVAKRVGDIEVQALLSKDYEKGIADLKLLVQDYPDPGLGAKIDAGISKFTALIRERDKEAVNECIREINSKVSSSENYNEGITMLKELLTRYPDLAPEINEEISKLTTQIQARDEKIFKTRIHEINEHVVSSKDYRAGMADLKALLAEYPAFEAEINERISKFEREFVLKNIRDINSSVSSSKNYDEGITMLKELLTRYSDFATEINEEVSKLTAQIQARDEKTVKTRIHEINEHVVSSKDYRAGMADLNALLAEYPAFEAEINEEISKFEREFVLKNIHDINSSTSSSKSGDEGITALKELLIRYPKFNVEINKEISNLTSELLKTVAISFDKPSMALGMGQSSTLKITTTPASIENIEYQWLSSNASVATVNNGTVTAAGFGTATINLLTSDGAIRATCTVSVNAMLGKDITAYQSDRDGRQDGIRELSKDNKAKMMGADYEYGLVGSGSIHYNIGGKYKSLSGILGTRDSSFKTNTNITISGDGNLLERFDLLHDDPVKPFTINLAGITQLSFQISDGSHGIFNIMLSSGDEITPQLNEPTGIYRDTSELGKDIKAYKLQYASEFTRANPIKMMGKEYEYGFSNDATYVVVNNRLQRTYAVTLSRVYYNINGKYKSISGEYGPLDGISSGAIGNIKILGDGRELGIFNVKWGDRARSFSIDVSGMTRLVFEITSNNSREYRKELTARFGLASMKLSQSPAKQDSSSISQTEDDDGEKDPETPGPIDGGGEGSNHPPPSPLCATCAGQGHTTCLRCNGNGSVAAEQRERCDLCKGTGTIAQVGGRIWGGTISQLPIPCIPCAGKGYKMTTTQVKCSTCGGAQTVNCASCRGSGKQR